jgi:hypothetical protein
VVSSLICVCVVVVWMLLLECEWLFLEAIVEETEDKRWETDQSSLPYLIRGEGGALQGSDSSRHANMISAVFACCWETSSEAGLRKSR